LSLANQNTNLTLINRPVEVIVFKEDGTEHINSPMRSLTLASKILKIDTKTIRKYGNKDIYYKGFKFIFKY
jgi:hypothetical protein